MKAKIIALEEMQIGDEVIVSWYNGGHEHGVIRSLSEVMKFSTCQSYRHYGVESAPTTERTIYNSDYVYLIHREKK